MSIRYRDVPLEEMVALNHSIRLHRNALIAHSGPLVEAMRSKNHPARKQLARIDGDLITLAAEIEGHAIRTFGLAAWDRARLEHWEICDASTGPVPLCDAEGAL